MLEPLAVASGQLTGMFSHTPCSLTSFLIAQPTSKEYHFPHEQTRVHPLPRPPALRPQRQSLERRSDGKVSTNVYLRRIHNHALWMDWLLKPVIPRLQWPKPVFKQKRAITGRARGHRGPRAEPRAPRLLRAALAHRRIANRRSLSHGGGHQLERPHDLLLPEEAKVPHRDQTRPHPLWR